PDQPPQAAPAPPAAAAAAHAADRPALPGPGPAAAVQRPPALRPRRQPARGRRAAVRHQPEHGVRARRHHPARGRQAARAGGGGLGLVEGWPDGWRGAVLDSAERGGEFLDRPAVVRERIQALEVRPANGPVTRLLDRAYALFADLDRDSAGGGEPPPRYLYIF